MAPHEAHGIPWKELIVPQAVNVGIFIGLLIYFIKKPLANHFSSKNEQYELQKKKAEEVRQQAETQNEKIRRDLEELERTADQTILNAKKEAQELSQKLMNEAKIQAERIENDAEQMVHFEYLRSIATLREEFIQNASAKAREVLKTANTESVDQKLNTEFLDKVRMVSK